MQNCANLHIQEKIVDKFLCQFIKGAKGPWATGAKVQSAKSCFLNMQQISQSAKLCIPKQSRLKRYISWYDNSFPRAKMFTIKHAWLKR